MGTNFDVRYNICEKCGNYDELHLGKSSVGWEFCFQGHDFLKINSVKLWKDFIDKNKGKIFDEYNRKLTWDEIMTWVENSKGGKEHSTLNSIGFYRGKDIERYYKDPEGYCFTDMDFS